MSPLEHLRAAQCNDLRTPADEALEAFLAEISIQHARLDLTPTTAIERRHLARVRSTHAA